MTNINYKMWNVYHIIDNIYIFIVNLFFTNKPLINNIIDEKSQENIEEKQNDKLFLQNCINSNSQKIINNMVHQIDELTLQYTKNEKLQEIIINKQRIELNLQNELIDKQQKIIDKLTHQHTKLNLQNELLIN